MAKRTRHQEMIRTGQPYTMVRAVKIPSVDPTPQGPVVYALGVYQVDGYTLELKFIDEDFQHVWEQHDLGQVSTLKTAHEVAAGWRERLVDEYDVK
jgi:hypothetical protein